MPTPVTLHAPSDRPAGPGALRPKAGRALAAAVVVAAGLLLAACQGSAPPPPAQSVGATEDRPVPAAIAELQLTDEHGQTVTLDSFRGHTLVMANFLTSCQEACPLTTGAFETMSSAVKAAHLGKRVVFAEVSIDPDRDVPSRLAAYAAYTGADLELLTGTQANLDRLWRYFGIYYQRVAEGSPPGVDWQTGRAYTYDMDHQDGFIIIDGRGHERFITVAMPDLKGHLSPRLARLLDDNGRQNLDHPEQGTWTVDQGLEALSWVLGQRVTAPGGSATPG